MGFQKRNNFFTSHLLRINPYMHICPCSRALGICKNIGILTYLGSMTVESVGFFRHFAFRSLGNRLASFFIVPENCILWGASCELIKNLATLFPTKLQGFHWTLLYHCYTLLNGGEIWVNCKHKITIWICTGRYRGIQIQSKSQFRFVLRDTEEFEFLDFD